MNLQEAEATIARLEQELTELRQDSQRLAASFVRMRDLAIEYCHVTDKFGGDDYFHAPRRRARMALEDTFRQTMMQLAEAQSHAWKIRGVAIARMVFSDPERYGRLSVEEIVSKLDWIEQRIREGALA